MSKKTHAHKTDKHPKAESDVKEDKSSAPETGQPEAEFDPFEHLMAGIGPMLISLALKHKKKPGVLYVNEAKRTYIGVHGHKVILHNVKEVDLSGNWIRTKSDDGFVLTNPANVLSIVINGEERTR